MNTNLALRSNLNANEIARNLKNWMHDPFAIGFESMFDQIREWQTAGGQQNISFPPYNIRVVEENKTYEIEMAVAGFEKENLNVEVEDNVLRISGASSDSEQSEDTFLHQGIAQRAFKREFMIADGVKIGDVKLKNGLLTIILNKEIPETNIKQIKIRE